MTQKVLVTGATGFVGRHLVNELTRRGYTVVALARNRKKFQDIFTTDPSPELVEGDLLDPEALRRGLRAAKILFHVAGVTKARTKQEFYRANHDACRLLYNLVLEESFPLERIIHVSSLAAMGPSPGPDPTEDFPEPRPLTHYGMSKLMGEQEALKLAKRLPVTIIRPPVVFGPADQDVLLFFQTIRRGLLPLVGNDAKRVSLVYVHDLVQALTEAAEREIPSGKAYFPCYDHPYGWGELGRITADIMDRRVRIRRIPHWVVWVVAGLSEFYSRLTGQVTILNLEKAREMVQSYWVCSNRSARQDLHFSPSMPIEDAFRETVQWYREHGQLA